MTDIVNSTKGMISIPLITSINDSDNTERENIDDTVTSLKNMDNNNSHSNINNISHVAIPETHVQKNEDNKGTLRYSSTSPKDTKKIPSTTKHPSKTSVNSTVGISRESSSSTRNGILEAPNTFSKPEKQMSVKYIPSSQNIRRSLSFKRTPSKEFPLPLTTVVKRPQQPHKNELLNNILDSIDIPSYIEFLKHPRKMETYRKKKKLSLYRQLILAQEIPAATFDTVVMNSDLQTFGSPISSIFSDPLSSTVGNGGNKNSILTLENPNAIWCLEFSKNGKYLASGDKNGFLKIWKVLSTPLERVHLKELESSKANFSLSRTTSGVGAQEHPLRNRQARAHTSPVPMQRARQSISSAFSFDTSSSSSTSNSSQTLSNNGNSPPPDMDPHPSNSNGKQKKNASKALVAKKSYAPIFNPTPFRVYHSHSADILSVDWSDNNFILTGSQDKFVRLWHLKKKSFLKQYEHPDFVTSVKFHPADDRFFLSGCLDHYLRLFSILDDEVSSEFDCNDLVTCLECSPGDGKYTVVGTFNGYILVFLTKKLRLLDCFHISKHNHIEIIKSELSDEDVDAYSSSSPQARIIDRVVPGPKITGLQLFQDPNNELRLVITSNDSKVRIVDFQKKETLEIMKGFSNKSMQLKAYANINTYGEAYVISPSEDHWVYGWKMQSSDTGNLLPSKTRCRDSFSLKSKRSMSSLVSEGTRDSSILSRCTDSSNNSSKKNSPGFMKKILNVFTNKKEINKTRGSSFSSTGSVGKSQHHALPLGSSTPPMIKNNSYVAFHAHHGAVTSVQVVPRETEHILSISNDFIFEMSSLYEIQKTNSFMPLEQSKFNPTGILPAGSALPIPSSRTRSSTISDTESKNGRLTEVPLDSAEIGVFRAITAGAIVVSGDSHGSIRVFRMDLPDDVKEEILKTMLSRQLANSNVKASSPPSAPPSHSASFTSLGFMHHS